jgi:hypothetical protein
LTSLDIDGNPTVLSRASKTHTGTPARPGARQGHFVLPNVPLYRPAYSLSPSGWEKSLQT